jgi:transcriptional regulator of heat shock response
MKTKHITDWKIVPSTDNTVSLIGVVDGQKVQTSPIQLARAGEVQTLNTHYILGERLAGMWELQLEMRRREQSDTLRLNGVL